jgi:hypothetical protein
MLLHILMITLGFAALCWGLSAAYRLKSPMDIIAAIVTLAGLTVTLLGVLLVTVPGFFQG